MFSLFSAIRRVISFCGVALILAFPLAARADDDLGPAVGTLAPAIGTPLDQTSKPRAAASLAGRNGTVLLFFRSADW